MAPNRFALRLCALIAVGGCSSADAGADAEVATAGAQTNGVAASAATGAAATAGTPAAVLAADSLIKNGEMTITRETFTYGGGTRDPFNSLVAGVSAGPELADLQLVGIYENLAEPMKSVIVLREKVGGKRHKMRTGERLGRIRLVRIQTRDAMFAVQDLGFERQETLSLRKQEDVTP